MNKDQIKFNKILSQNRKNAKVKLCLWGGEDKTGCSRKIIDAHSIQRGKILSSISDLGKVYHLGGSSLEDMSGVEFNFRLEGIKKFSTFTGFCGEHDKSIFQPIEDILFTGTETQKNIYAYRAVAKELHANLESSKLCNNLLGEKLNDDDLPLHLRATLPSVLKGELIVPDFIKEKMIEGAKNDYIRARFKQTNLNISELRIISEHLRDVINGKIESDFEHIYHCFDSIYPIACSSSFIPYFDYKGDQLISDEKIINIAMESAHDISSIRSVVINIFPENSKTHIIFSLSREHIDFKNSIKRLFSSTEECIKRSISNVLLNYVENIAFNPRYMEEQFDEEEKELIKSAFAKNISDTSVFTKTEINLFKKI